MRNEISCDLVGASNHSEVLNALKSRYRCVREPLPADDGSYLTSLWVFKDREVNASESPIPDSYSDLVVDQNIIDSHDSHTIKEKIASILKVLKFREKHVLVQFWSPVVVMKRLVLTTWEQPFGLGVADKELYSYRLNSEGYTIVADGDHKGKLGSPGRVYKQKLPEWSLDTHSQNGCYNIHGYINLPVFETSSDCCAGVLEIITSSSYADFAFEVHEVSKALKDQSLRSPNMFEDPSFRTADKSVRHELEQISKVLKTVCDIHNLPLAQTWAPYGYNSYVSNSGNLEPSCSNFNKSCIGKVCMSSVGLPWYIRDSSMWEFHEACTKKHIYKSQGVVGKSLSSCGTLLCEDVGKLDENDYPLVHIARMSGLTSCLAIYLKSLEADVEHVIEFFLPAHSANETYIRRLMETVNQRIENSYWMQLDIRSPPEVFGGILSDWNLEANLTTTPPELKNMEYVSSTSASRGTSKSVVPISEKEIGDFDINTKTIKGKRMSSIRLEDITKHFGKPMDEAITILGVSKSTLKRICRDFGIPRWPKSNPSNKSDADETAHVVVHTFEGATHVPQQHEANMTSPNVFEDPNFRIAYERRPPPCPTKLLTEKRAVPPSKSKNMEIVSSTFAIGGTSKSVVPFSEKELGDFDINTGKTKRKRMSSIRLEDIIKHFGKPIVEAATILNVSRSTLKRICRDFGVPRWPKSNRQDHVIVHTSEGALTPTPFFEASNEQFDVTTTYITRDHNVVEQFDVTTTYITRDHNVVIENGYHSFTHVPHQQEQATPLVAWVSQDPTYCHSFGLLKLPKLVAAQLHLEIGNVRLKYLVAENDMMLICCDCDLGYAMSIQPEYTPKLNLFVVYKPVFDLSRSLEVDWGQMWEDLQREYF